MKTHNERALIVSALWLHLGFIGAAALVAGLLQLFDASPAWPLSLGLMLCGGVLAAAGWRRGWMVLERTGQAPAVSTDASRESIARARSGPTGHGATRTLTVIALRSNTEARQ